MKLGYGIKPWTPEEERLKSLISARLRPMRSRSSCTAALKQFTHELKNCVRKRAILSFIKDVTLNSLFQTGPNLTAKPEVSTLAHPRRPSSLAREGEERRGRPKS